ncbi:hypothetical protein LWI29_003112 [Acer saccharum]|uniref:Uncharacterized protein n=1 Tax=Acer saccharum TaxID=4024 RepID=A0AA39STM0_ACESA|nr:hypothetical protein LWI29_003112 [Acer saccharum]
MHFKNCHNGPLFAGGGYSLIITGKIVVYSRYFQIFKITKVEQTRHGRLLLILLKSNKPLGIETFVSMDLYLNCFDSPIPDSIGKADEIEFRGIVYW